MIKPTNKKKELDKKYNKLPNFFLPYTMCFPLWTLYTHGENEKINITFIIGAWAALPPSLQVRETFGGSQ